MIRTPWLLAVAALGLAACGSSGSDDAESADTTVSPRSTAPVEEEELFSASPESSDGDGDDGGAGLDGSGDDALASTDGGGAEDGPAPDGDGLDSSDGGEPTESAAGSATGGAEDDTGTTTGSGGDSSGSTGSTSAGAMTPVRAGRPAATRVVPEATATAPTAPTAGRRRPRVVRPARAGPSRSATSTSRCSSTPPNSRRSGLGGAWDTEIFVEEGVVDGSPCGLGAVFGFDHLYAFYSDVEGREFEQIIAADAGSTAVDVLRGLPECGDSTAWSDDLEVTELSTSGADEAVGLTVTGELDGESIAWFAADVDGTAVMVISIGPPGEEQFAEVAFELLVSEFATA